VEVSIIERGEYCACEGIDLNGHPGLANKTVSKAPKNPMTFKLRFLAVIIVSKICGHLNLD